MTVHSNLSTPTRASKSSCKCSCHEGQQTPSQDSVSLSGGMSAADAEYFRLLDIERSKPDWDTSQARQAWLHWG